MMTTAAELMEIRSLLKDRLQLHNKALTNDYQDRINELLLRAAYIAIENIIDNRVILNVTDSSS